MTRQPTQLILKYGVYPSVSIIIEETEEKTAITIAE
jgi:hypothetical protein